MRHLLRENGTISPSDERSKGVCEGIDRRLRKVAEIDTKTPIDSEIVGWPERRRFSEGKCWQRIQSRSKIRIKRHEGMQRMERHSKSRAPAPQACQHMMPKLKGIQRNGDTALTHHVGRQCTNDYCRCYEYCITFACQTQKNISSTECEQNHNL